MAHHGVRDVKRSAISEESIEKEYEASLFDTPIKRDVFR